MRSFLFPVLLALSFVFAACDSEQIVEPEGSFFTDARDGQRYRQISLGDQVWMAENLRFLSSGRLCYNDELTACETHGGLYVYSEATNVCPEGWHLPTDLEWQELEMHLGMSMDAADAMGWRGSDQGKQLKNGGGSGFRAFLSGFHANGSYGGQGSQGVCWTATPDPDNSAFALSRELGSSQSQIRRIGVLRVDAYSVRCVAD
jgi:uncharacterized protein (TIGR02145 family)